MERSSSIYNSIRSTPTRQTHSFCFLHTVTLPLMHINTFPFASFSHKRVKHYHSLFSLSTLSLRLFPNLSESLSEPVFIRRQCDWIRAALAICRSLRGSPIHMASKAASCRRGEKRRGGDMGSILEQEGRGLDRSVQRQYLLSWQLSEPEQRAVNRGTDKWQSWVVQETTKQQQKRVDTIRCIQMNLKTK